MAGVPHRQVVLTIPNRLRTWCLYRRTLLGDLARVAARPVTAAVRALTGEPALAVGIVGCIQTHGSLANWHPHIHMIATDGGFRADGTFVPWPAHDTAQLTEAFRRAVLRLFVRRGLFEREDAEAMLAWPPVGLAGLSTIAFEGSSIGGAAIALCCIGAIAGFLVWNFPAGRLFAGDSGALFSGAIAAFACLIVIARTGMSPLIAPILFFPVASGRAAHSVLPRAPGPFAPRRSR